MGSGYHQAGDMGDINHQHGSDFIGYRTKTGKIKGSGVGTGAGDNHVRPLTQGDLFDSVVVEPFAILINPIKYRAVELTGKADRGSVGKVTAMGQIHS